MRVGFAVLLALAMIGVPSDSHQERESTPLLEKSAPLVLCQLTASTEEERRGCCSWHGGVCGCSGVRAQCCDGSLSPSCGC